MRIEFEELRILTGRPIICVSDGNTVTRCASLWMLFIIRSADTIFFDSFLYSLPTA